MNDLTPLARRCFRAYGAKGQAVCRQLPLSGENSAALCVPN
jgi:hypothetical protein